MSAHATEAHFKKAKQLFEGDDPATIVRSIAQALADAEAAEREAAAQIADQGERDEGPGIATWIADEIRARGQS